MCTVQMAVGGQTTQQVELMLDRGSVLPNAMYAKLFPNASLSAPGLSLVSKGGNWSWRWLHSAAASQLCLQRTSRKPVKRAPAVQVHRHKMAYLRFGFNTGTPLQTEI